MEVRVDPSAGFCFGVQRAVDKVYEMIETGRPIYTYGPVVHNETVVSDLESKGVEVIESEQALRELVPKENAAVIIRAHGIPRRIYELLESKGIEVIDCTCPFVIKIQKLAREHSRMGQHILIAGNPNHPEVEGIVGWCEGPVTVLETPEDAARFEIVPGTEFFLVSQTTYKVNKFSQIVEIFGNTVYNDNVVNTICSATQVRQRHAEELASQADVMIVIGGRNSSNTRKLYEICAERCPETYYIQTLDDLHLERSKSVNLVGITAGASTPKKIIEEVQNYVRTYF
ncbi:MAG: 4-hydroxy-3-methylbut-2-enyl diphosphate reductase [Lachnospiraceae bacterium]|nr:4-hydroxy-3-methylbut-2-enyl diphosphate reductase [Lachnospiraceae bacterium]